MYNLHLKHDLLSVAWFWAGLALNQSQEIMAEVHVLD